MRRTLIAPLASLTALALTSPAMADTLFRCENGTPVVLCEVGREMRINGHTDRFSVALPLAHAYGDSSVRTPRRFYEEDGTCTPELAVASSIGSLPQGRTLSPISSKPRRRSLTACRSPRGADRCVETDPR